MNGLITGPWYVAWRAEPGKVPYTGTDAKANVWTDGPFLTYEAATALAATDGFAGVGVVHSAAHDLVGVDVDGCRDPVTGDLTDWARGIVDALDGVLVVTPSKTGVRVWLRAAKDAAGPRKRKWSRPDWQAPAGVAKAPGVEVFLTGGFCTLPSSPIDDIPERPAQLAALLAAAPPPAVKIARADVALRNPDLTLDELQALVAARHAKRYHKLFIAGRRRSQADREGREGRGDRHRA